MEGAWIVTGPKPPEPPPFWWRVATFWWRWCWEFFVGPVLPILIALLVDRSKKWDGEFWLKLLWSSETAFFVIMVPLLVAERARTIAKNIHAPPWWLPRVQKLCWGLIIVAIWNLHTYYLLRSPKELQEVSSNLVSYAVLSLTAICASLVVVWLEFRNTRWEGEP
jgi:hypothetical protein